MNAYLLRMVSLALLLGFGSLNAYADDIDSIEANPKFVENISKANSGYWAACRYIAEVYEEYGSFEKSIPYWECAMKVPRRRYNRNPSMSHLAGHYFHCIGVEKDPSKGAMYLILAERYTWPHDRRKWWHILDIYHDISKFPNIEQNFQYGAELAKDYLAQAEYFDLNTSNAEIHRRLELHLRAIRRVENGGTLKVFLLYVLMLIVISLLVKRFASFGPFK